MIPLNFPEYPFTIKDEGGRPLIIDPVRKRFVALTPEEWVRQHVIRYLSEEKGVPLSLMRVETEISLYKTKKRFDIAVFSRNGKALMIVECKAPEVGISRETLDQALRYNLALQVRHMLLTNGLNHYYFAATHPGGTMEGRDEIPHFSEMKES